MHFLSPVTVQGHALDYKVLSLQCPVNHLLSLFFHPHISHCLSSYPNLFAIVYTLSVTVLLNSSHHFSGFTQIAYIILGHCKSFPYLPFSYIQLLLNPWDKSILVPATA